MEQILVTVLMLGLVCGGILILFQDAKSIFKKIKKDKK
jgi:hypothetical protein